ncbi:MAG: hypothetical protein JXX28_08055 [Deltaproteobacteria bacterium]|nr:hypothetical protein [Deltaproteobacteria bacterium]
MLLSLLTAAALASPWPALDHPAATGGGERDAAVLIAVEDYAYLPDVPGAVDNGWAWHAWMRGRGVPEAKVATLFDAVGHSGEPLARAERIRSQVALRAGQVEEGGRLWVVFIGHGAPAADGSDGLLVGADAGSSADGLFSRSVARGELLGAAREGGAPEVVLVLDACFSGQTGGGEALAGGLQPVIPTAMVELGALELLAAGTGQLAGALPGEARPAFSYLLLGALQGWGDADGDGLVTAEEAHAYTLASLRGLSELTQRTQEPVLRGSGAVVLGAGALAGPDLGAIKLATLRGAAPHRSRGLAIGGAGGAALSAASFALAWYAYQRTEQAEDLGRAESWVQVNHAAWWGGAGLGLVSGGLLVGAAARGEW